MSPTHRCWGPVLAVHKAVLAVEVIVLWKLREKYTGFGLESANWTVGRNHEHEKSGVEDVDMGFSRDREWK